MNESYAQGASEASLLGFRALDAPTSIERIDLYGAGNDAEMAATHPRVDLYSVRFRAGGVRPG